MPPKIVLKLKTSVSYNLLKSERLKVDPDLKVIGGDGSVQHIHKDLLRCVSSKFYHALEYSKEKGHDLECLGSIKVPGLDETGLKCLYDLLYKGSHLIDASKADDIINRLNNLDLSLTNHEHNGSIEEQDDSTNDVHIDVHIDVQNPSSQADAQNNQQSDVQNEGPIDLHADGHNNNNNVHSDTTYSPEPPSSTGKKPRGCKVKYPLSPAQEELVKFYRLIEESLPNPKPYFVGKNIRCFHCNQTYPKVRLWKDHIMNDHYHRAQTCENCGEVFTYTFYLHRRTCIPAGELKI